MSVNVKKEDEEKDKKQGDNNVEELNAAPSNNTLIIEEDYNASLEKAIHTLGLARHNVLGCGDCQLLAMCLAYFGRRRYDESDRNKDIINFKRCMINAYYNNLGI